MLKGHNEISGSSSYNPNPSDQITDLLGAHQHAEMSYFGDMTLDCQLPSRCLHGIFDNDTIGGNYKKLDSYYQS